MKKNEMEKINAEPITPEDQYKLSMYYYKGDAIQQNFYMAKYWLIKAAENGHPLAKIKLKELYLDEYKKLFQNKKNSPKMKARR